MLTIQFLIETAIQRGADTIELEYVPEGLEVSYFRGSTGIGEIIDDRESVTVIINDLISRAKLEHKYRGRFKIAHQEREYELWAEQYESFGESAFRLRFGKVK